MPVSAAVPRGVTETGCLTLAVKSDEQHPRLRADETLIPIDFDSRMGDRSIMRPPSHVDCPEMLWPP